MNYAHKEALSLFLCFSAQSKPSSNLTDNSENKNRLAIENDQSPSLHERKYLLINLSKLKEDEIRKTTLKTFKQFCLEFITWSWVRDNVEACSV